MEPSADQLRILNEMDVLCGIYLGRLNTDKFYSVVFNKETNFLMQEIKIRENQLSDSFTPEENLRVPTSFNLYESAFPGCLNLTQYILSLMPSDQYKNIRAYEKHHSSQGLAIESVEGWSVIAWAKRISAAKKANSSFFAEHNIEDPN